LARRDGLPGDIAAPESLGEHQRETVLLIHGTFANKVVSPPAWWHPGSDFCHKLDLSLSQQGSPARCWAHIGSSTNPTNVFAWTGGNLESERHIGGDSLAKEILDLETNYDVSRYHIVAHSHGGNVVLHALRSLADDPKNLGAVIFLGTPVLLFSLRASWLTRSAVALLFCGVGLVSSIAAAVLGGESRLRSVLLVGVFNSLRNSLFFAGEFPTLSILMAIGFGSLLLVEWWNRPRRQLPIYGSGHAHAFEFAPDEAMKALQLSLGFAQRPGDVLEQLFSTKAPPEYAVDPPRPEFRMKGLWSDFKKTAPFLRGRNVQKLTAILTCIFVVLAVFSELPVVLVANLIYRTKERPYLLNLIELIQKLLVDMFFALELPFGFIFALALMLMFFRLFLSDVFKFAWLSIARAFQLFLRGPGGAWIMGAVVRNYAVGGQCKMVLRPPELPEKERARRETISDKLNEKMNDLSSKTAAQAGEALYSAFAEGDAMKLKDHIHERLTNPELAHCQYYCEDEIINRIAELIAAPYPLVASGFDSSKRSGLL
jgi:pimeloyl-ACP methyl ester carboxylesterase